MRRKQYGWQLPPEIEARLGESTYGSQRAIYEADHLLIILHAPPRPDERQREAHVFLRKPDGKLLWNGMENGESQLKKLIAIYREVLEDFERAHDRARNARALFEVLEHLAPVVRSSANFYAALQAARQLAKEDVFLIAARDDAYEISRNFELLLTEARHHLDYRVALGAEAHAAKAEEMAVAQHKLNIIAAVTFPLMAVATVFGMNMPYGFEDRVPALFWLVLLLGGAAGFLTRQWVNPSRL